MRGISTTACPAAIQAPACLSLQPLAIVAAVIGPGNIAPVREIPAAISKNWLRLRLVSIVSLGQDQVKAGFLRPVHPLRQPHLHHNEEAPHPPWLAYLWLLWANRQSSSSPPSTPQPPALTEQLRHPLQLAINLLAPPLQPKQAGS